MKCFSKADFSLPIKAITYQPFTLPQLLHRLLQMLKSHLFNNKQLRLRISRGLHLVSKCLLYPGNLGVLGAYRLTILRCQLGSQSRLLFPDCLPHRKSSSWFCRSRSTAITCRPSTSSGWSSVCSVCQPTSSTRASTSASRPRRANADPEAGPQTPTGLW